MKIDRTKLKKSSGVSLSPPVATLIADLLSVKCDWSKFAAKLAVASNCWNYGKTELCHWVDVLDVCDEILQEATTCAPNSDILNCDVAGEESMQITLKVLTFIALIFEHSFSRHLFNSADRLLGLLNSSTLELIVAVLQVLYVFSKRSNYLVKISQSEKTFLLSHLECLAENWGGKDSGMSLAQCCAQKMKIPEAAAVVNLEYEITEESGGQPAKATTKSLTVNIANCKSTKPTEILEEILPKGHKLQEKHRIALFTRIRLACNFADRNKRLMCVMARLQAISILVYSTLMRDDQEVMMEGLVYPGFLDECVEVLKLDDQSLHEIKTEMLKMLCSIIYLDRSPKLHLILEVMNVSSYHGFLPSLVRSVIASLRQSHAPTSTSAPQLAPVSTPLAIALFSFIYHMAGYDNGAEALVRSGMTESLLAVIQWEDCPLELITFVTRAVRVLDLISFNDVQSFQNAGGIQMIVNRLVLEVEVCRNEQPYTISPVLMRFESIGSEPMSQPATPQPQNTQEEGITLVTSPIKGVFCHQQRSVLIKSLLNLLKKTLQEQLMADSVRRMMDGNLPKALIHIVSNPDYYGPPLFLNALTVTTNFIFQEPQALQALQDKGLADVILQALLDKEIPALRDVVSCVPTCFNALCLNDRGRAAFAAKNPFEKFLKMFTSTKYLSAIKRKKGIDQRVDQLDTAMCLGTAIDELMRHQPTLKNQAMKAIVDLVKELYDLSVDPKITCVSKSATATLPHSGSKSVISTAANAFSVQASSESSDDEDEAESGEAILKSDNDVIIHESNSMDVDQSGTSNNHIAIVPLVDFIQNVMKFLEAIFASVAPGDHAKLFVSNGGIGHLANLFNAPNLPSDFGQSSACISLANVVKHIVQQTQDVTMQSQLMTQLLATLESRKEESPVEGSTHLQYLMNWNEKQEGKQFMDSNAMRELGRSQAQLMVLVQLAKQATSATPTSTSELKKKVVSLWTREPGVKLMSYLAKYQSEIVWDQCVLLALTCSYESSVTPVENYAPSQVQYIKENSLTKTVSEESIKDKEKKDKNDLHSQLAPDLKALVHLVQKTGKELSDLLSLQMRLCIGQMSRRRGHATMVYVSPGQETIPLAKSVCLTLKDALSWKPPKSAPSKLRYTYMIYVINQLPPLLFENRRNAYHVMLFNFYETNAHKALIEIIQPVLKIIQDVSVAGDPFLDGVEELLESWLCLMERLCNPCCIVDSQMLHSDENVTDDKLSSINQAKRYLLTAQKDAFGVVQALWLKCSKLKSPKVMEAALNVLCHILRAEKTINELDKPEKEDRKSPEPERAQMEAQIDAQMLQQLLDMGFEREPAIHALFMCGNVETAAEWCLSHPQTAATRQPVAPGILPVMDEEEQFQRALALSLENGDAQESSQQFFQLNPDVNAAGSTESEGASASTAAENASASTENNVTNNAPNVEQPEPQPQLQPAVIVPANEIEGERNACARMAAGMDIHIENVDEQLDLMKAPLLEWNQVMKFADEVLVSECFSMMDNDSSLVYRIADCLSVAITAFGNQWKATERLLRNVIGEISKVASTGKSWVSNIGDPNCVEANTLFSRLHLLCLLFEELRETCVTVMAPEQHKLIWELCCVLSLTVENLKPNDSVPKFVTALLLWLDLHERAAVALYRKRLLNDKVGLNRVWKYWDNGWNTYLPPLRAKIEAEYIKGSPSVKFTQGRNRYMLDFSTMTQINLETNFERHVFVMKGAERRKEMETQTQAMEEKDMETQTLTTNVEETASTNDKPSCSNKISAVEQVNLAALSFEVKAKVIESCVRLLSLSSDCLCMQAVLRICLRLTRDSALAADFVTMGGLEALLSLRQEHAFPGINNVLGLIVRHVLEQGDTLRHTMEKVIRTVVSAPMNRWSQQQLDPRTNNVHDFHDSLRTLAPLAARDTNLFEEVYSKTVQFKVKPDETVASNLVCPVSGQSSNVTPTPTLTSVISVLVQYLTKNLSVPKSNKTEELIATEPMDTTPLGSSTGNVAQVPKTENKTEEKKCDKKCECNDCLKKKEESKKLPLVPKCAILRLLGELVRSYSAVPLILTDTRVFPGNQSLVKEETSLLGYLLDELLVVKCEDCNENECPAAVKVLMATIASSNHAPDAQNALVMEVKSSLHRTMISGESDHKHARLVSLVGIVGLLKDSCPNVHASHNAETQPTPKTPTSLQSNAMLRLISRKRLLLDLARIPLCLQLTSPNAVGTLNSVLKVLDDLVRLINAPQVQSTQNNTHTVRPTPNTASASVNIPAIVIPSTLNGGETVEIAAPPVNENVNHDNSSTANNTSNAPSDTNTEGSGTRSMVQHLEDLFYGAAAEDASAFESSDSSNSQPNQDASDWPAGVELVGTMEEGAPQENNVHVYAESSGSSSSSESENEGEHRHEGEDGESSVTMEDNEEDITMQDHIDDNIPQDEVGNEAGSEHSDFDEMEEAGTGEDYEEDEEEEDVSDYEQDYNNYNHEHNMDHLFWAELNAPPFGGRTRDVIAGGGPEFDAMGVHPANGGGSAAFGLTHPLLNRPIDSPHNDLPAHGATRSRRTEPYGARGGHWLFGLHRQGAIRQRHGANRLPLLDRHNHELTNILQRLYGPGVGGMADDLLNVARAATTGVAGQNRMFITEDDWMRRQLGDFEDYMEDGGTSGRMVIVSQVPGALNRWTEESRLLDGASVHILVHSLAQQIEDKLDVNRQKLIQENVKKQAEAAEKSKAEALKAKAEAELKAAARAKLPSESKEELGTKEEAKTEETSADVVADPQSGSNPEVAQASGSTPVVALNPAENMEVDMVQPPTVNPVPTPAVDISMDQSQPAAQIASPGEVSEAGTQPIVSPIQSDAVSNINNASGVTVNSSEGEAQAEIPAAQATAEPTAVIPDEFRALLGDMEVPEGVDPAFLAALPENMRREVIDDHLRRQRVQRLRQQQRAIPAEPSVSTAPVPENTVAILPVASLTSSNAATASNTATTSNSVPGAQPTNPTNTVPQISPEFLDALPPELQEEVLTQQRAAQQANRPPQQDDAFDATAFLDTLSPQLRTQVLAEADDAQILALPANLAAEARRLRGDLERRQLHRFAHGMHRMYDPGTRDGNYRYTMRLDASDYQGGERWSIGFGGRPLVSQNRAGISNSAVTPTVKGQQLLDREALTGLLALFFVCDPKFNHGRLHRIVKSVCHHSPTRDWLIRALISILHTLRTNNIPNPSARENSDGESWLNLTVSTGLGGKAPVFIFKPKTQQKKSNIAMNCEDIVIHPQACVSVCLHVLDTLISLSKSFPSQFVPRTLTNQTKESEESVSTPSTSASSKLNDAFMTDFWNILIKLDSAGPQNAVVPASTPIKQASRLCRSGSNSGGRGSIGSTGQILQFPDEATYNKLNESPLGRLMGMLDHPVIIENMNLMERHLRLLHQLLTSLPENTFNKLVNAEGLSEDGVVLEWQISLAVDVITQRKCTNDAYWNAYNTLIECVNKFGPSSGNAIKRMLIDGAKKLGEDLNTQIRIIIDELSRLPANQTNPADSGSNMEDTKNANNIFDRYTGEGLVLRASDAVRPRVPGALGTCLEMQLAGMESLTATDSVQHHLLRTLNTVIKVEKEIRDNVAKLEAQKKADEISRRKAEEISKKMLEDAKKEELPVAQKETAAVDESATAGNSGANEISNAVGETTALASETQPTPESKQHTINVEQPESPKPAAAPSLSELLSLDVLWSDLSLCLCRLDEASDPHAVLVLQPAAEAFFVVHAAEENNKQQDENALETRHESGSSTVNPESGSRPSIPEMQMSFTETTTSDKKDSKLVEFALKHRRVLNQILRQSENQLMDGPFAVLIHHPRLLDFDVKRQYFRKELARQNERSRLRREDRALHVRRQDVFQDSFRELHRLSPQEWKSRLYIVFQGEEGQDAGGLMREWYAIITREIFNPNYALFKVAPGDKVTFMINPMSNINVEHLDYFKFVGHLIAKAVYDNKLLDCYFSRAFYKHILNKQVNYQDIESEDPQFFQSLEYIRKNSITDMDLTFSLEVNEFGVIEERELKPGGKNIEVTNENKEEYVRLTCQMKMTGAIRKQLQEFLSGFYDIIPKRLISIFNEQELELLISGLPTIDLDDLQKHTDYNKYTKNSPQIRWFWRALRSFEPADVAKFLQFVTGTSKVPLAGFGALEGMGGTQRFSIHMVSSIDRLPTSHTCFNQLDLPAYETYEKLRDQLLIAIRECNEGFGFA